MWCVCYCLREVYKMETGILSFPPFYAFHVIEVCPTNQQKNKKKKTSDEKNKH